METKINSVQKSKNMKVNQETLIKVFKADFFLETNISWIFFSSEYVYKVNRPVKLDFIDFTNSAVRQSVAKVDFEINKIFSPETYLELIFLTESGGQIILNGEGPLLDYAIKMRRFNQESNLVYLLERGDQIADQTIQKIADKICSAHLGFMPDQKSLNFGQPGIIDKNWRQTIGLLRTDALGVSLNDFELSELEKLMGGYFQKMVPVFEERVKEKAVQRIHGDLHAENVFIKDGEPYFIDVILPIDDWSFGDVAIDIGALAMDLESFRRGSQSRLLVELYAKKKKDSSLGEVILFYKIYWANIRLWVNSLLLKKGGGSKDKISRYKNLLKKYLEDIDIDSKRQIF